MGWAMTTTNDRPSMLYDKEKRTLERRKGQWDSCCAVWEGRSYAEVVGSGVSGFMSFKIVRRDENNALGLAMMAFVKLSRLN